MALLKSNTIVYGTATIQGQLTVGNNVVFSSNTIGITFGDGTKQTTAGGGGSASIGTVVTTASGWNLP